MVFSMNQQYNETDPETKKLNQKKIYTLLWVAISLNACSHI